MPVKSLPVIKNCRWYIVGLLFAATTISYIDRQNLAIIAPHLRDELGISNSGYAQILTAFLLSYTVLQAVTGWLIDRLGSRKGFALIVLWWSIAAVLHYFGNDVASFSIYRFLLGAGEAGSWAACVKAVAEWFPHRERGLANSIWGAGTSAGLIISVPLVSWITLVLGWQYSFIVTGLMGFLWLALWMGFYHLPQLHPCVGADELALIEGDQQRNSLDDNNTIHYFSLLRTRNVWAVVLARSIADPCIWFYQAWIPEYLKRDAGFSMAEIGKYAWIPFLTQGIGIILGGLLSDRLYRRGMKVIHARLVVMAAGMVFMSAGVVAAFPLTTPVVFLAVSTTTFGFGLWGPNMMTLCGEAFPRQVVGSVTGLAGMGAGIGGMGFMLLTGWVLDDFGYSPVFVAAGLLPLLALAVILFVLDRDQAEFIASSTSKH